MELDFLLPPLDLEPCIERIWRWRSVPGEVVALPLLAPGVGAELFFHLGQPFRLADAVFPLVHLIAVRKKPLDFEPQENVHVLAVRFRAGMVRHFLPCLLGDVSRDWMPAEDLWGPGIRNLLHRLADTDSFPGQARLLCAWLREQRNRQEKLDGAVDFALESIYADPAAARMEALPELIGLGPRQFQRRFKAAIGLSAKRFHRLVRLYRLVRQEILNPGQIYLDAALDLGFFDQAHVIHDFQELTGRSPANFLREAGARTHFYNPSRGRRT